MMSSVTGTGVNLASQALNVHAVGMQVAAHNIANVSTDGFRAQTATFAVGSGGVGVELESVYRQRPALGSQVEARGEDSALMQASGTELARELVHMSAMQRGFEANAAVIKTADELTGTLFNLIA